MCDLKRLSVQELSALHYIIFSVELESVVRMENEESKSITDIALEGVLLILIGIFGMIGNSCTIYIFATSKNQQTFHRLMMMLAAFDNVHILFNFLIFSFPLIFPQYEQSAFYNYLLPLLLPLNQIALTGSIYAKLAITLERYLIVCHPFYVISHRWKAKLYIWPIVIYSVVYNLPKFFEIQTSVNSSSPLSTKHPPPDISPIIDHLGDPFNSSMNTKNLTTTYGIKPTSLREDLNYISIYMIWINFILMGFVPFTLLIVLNALTLKSLKQHLAQQATSEKGIQLGSLVDSSMDQASDLNGCSNSSHFENRNNEMSLAKVSIVIVIIFIACHSIRWVPNIYEMIQHTQNNGEFQWPSWVESITHVSHLLTTFNSSINFYIYFFSHLRKRS